MFPFPKETAMDILLALCIGIGLSAACGFRVFVPLLVMSIAAHSGHLTLAQNMQWIGSTPAMIAFGSATALEIGAYYIPWLDNLLDSIATPAAIVAGSIATASVVTGMDPMLQWSVAIIGGGTVAGGVQVLTVVGRGVSSVTTAGFANPLFSTSEAGAATGFSILAIALPIVAAIVVLLLLLLGAKILIGLRRRRRARKSPR